MRSDHSLWIGGNLEGTLPALNVTREGKILRKMKKRATSIAVDPVTKRKYVNDGYYSLYTTKLGAAGLAGRPVGPVYPGDMTFVDGKIWVANATDKSLDWIDPATGAVGREILLPFSPRGISYDGLGFWLTAMDDDDHLVRVTSSVAPCPAEGSEDCELGQVDVNLDLEFSVFGVAWDSTDGTLWVGSKGSVVHITTAGVLLGSFPVADGRYVNALEFQGERGRP